MIGLMGMGTKEGIPVIGLMGTMEGIRVTRLMGTTTRE